MGGHNEFLGFDLPPVKRQLLLSLSTLPCSNSRARCNYSQDSTRINRIHYHFFIFKSGHKSESGLGQQGEAVVCLTVDEFKLLSRCHQLRVCFRIAVNLSNQKFCIYLCSLSL